MLQTLFYALTPLIVLLTSASLSCIAGYYLMHGVEDLFSLAKVITKLTQLFLVLSIFPFMAFLNINREELGFASRNIFFKQVLQGFGLGLATLMPVLIAEYYLGIHVIDQTKNWTFSFTVQKMILSLLLALIISLFEESLFRGILLAALKRKMPVIAAVLISSCYYAALHFLSSHSVIPKQEMTILSGFILLTEAFANVLNPDIVSAFLALLIVGIFLGLLRTWIPTSLGLCIGCHTSWVWQIKMNKSLFITDYKSKYSYLVSSYDGVIGPFVTGWLMLFIFGYFVYAHLNRAKTLSK